MKTATIYFSDKSTLTVHEDDFIIPIVQNPIIDNQQSASMGVPVELYNHIHDGLFPSIMDALCFCSFFYVNSNTDSPLYCTHSIVKIEND